MRMRPPSRVEIRHNNVLGLLLVEVSAQHGDKLMSPPLNATFIHRQTLAGQVRFTTSELRVKPRPRSPCRQRALNIETEIYERLCAKALEARDGIFSEPPRMPLQCSMFATALAKLAVDDNYVRPGQRLAGFAIEAGRRWSSRR